MQPAACGRIKVRFAPDSLLEGDGFELPVPQQIRSDLGTAGPSPITVDSLATRNWSSNPFPSSKESGANLPRCAHLHRRRVTVCRGEEFALLPSMTISATGNRMFESISLQQTVCLSPASAFER